MGLFDRFSKKNKAEEEKPQDSTPQPQPTPEDIKQLLISTLHELGCQPESDKDGDIFFRYQGESFLAIIVGKFLRVWDLPYLRINVLDTRLPLVLEAINTVNGGFGPVIVMRDPDENGNRSVASRMDFIFIPEIPDLTQYLDSILSMFFNTKHRLNDEIDKFTTNRSDRSQSSSFTSGSPSQN